MNNDQTPKRVSSHLALTRLSEAIYSGDLAQVQLALADPELRNPAELAPLETAVAADQPHILKYFLSIGMTMTAESPFPFLNTSALDTAVYFDRPEMLEILLLEPDAKDVINRFDENWLGWTPLIRAVKEKRLHLVRRLIEAGADVNANDESHIGETALCEAVQDNEPEFVRVLLSAGALPDIPGWMWQTARDRATKACLEIQEMIARTPHTPIKP